MTWSSDLIVLGYPRAVEPDTLRTNDSKFEELVTIEVDRVLYGTYGGGELHFRWVTDRATSIKREVDYAAEGNARQDRPQLFFLRRMAEEGERATWTLRSNVLIRQSAQGLATATGELVKTADEILRVVEDESRRRAFTVLGVNVAPGRDELSRTKTLAQGCFDCIAPRGAVLLRIQPKWIVVAPAYAQFLADVLVLCQSDDWRERERGAYMLRSYPGEVGRSMLTMLLRDEGVYRWNMSSTRECVSYQVRAAAYDVLREQGIVVAKPLLDECHNR